MFGDEQISKQAKCESEHGSCVRDQYHLGYGGGEADTVLAAS